MSTSNNHDHWEELASSLNPSEATEKTDSEKKPTSKRKRSSSKKSPANSASEPEAQNTQTSDAAASDPVSDSAAKSAKEPATESGRSAKRPSRRSSKSKEAASLSSKEKLNLLDENTSSDQEKVDLVIGAATKSSKSSHSRKAKENDLLTQIALQEKEAKENAKKQDQLAFLVQQIDERALQDESASDDPQKPQEEKKAACKKSSKSEMSKKSSHKKDKKAAPEKSSGQEDNIFFDLDINASDFSVADFFADADPASSIQISWGKETDGGELAATKPEQASLPSKTPAPEKPQEITATEKFSGKSKDATFSKANAEKSAADTSSRKNQKETDSVDSPQAFSSSDRPRDRQSRRDRKRHHRPDEKETSRESLSMLDETPLLNENSFQKKNKNTATNVEKALNMKEEDVLEKDWNLSSDDFSEEEYRFTSVDDDDEIVTGFEEEADDDNIDEEEFDELEDLCVSEKKSEKRRPSFEADDAFADNIEDEFSDSQNELPKVLWGDQNREAPSSDNSSRHSRRRRDRQNRSGNAPAESAPAKNFNEPSKVKESRDANTIPEIEFPSWSDAITHVVGFNLKRRTHQRDNGKKNR